MILNYGIFYYYNSILQRTNTEMPKLPKCLKIKAPWEIALRQKSLSKKSLEKHPVLHFDLIEIAFIAGYCFISNYLT